MSAEALFCAELSKLKRHVIIKFVRRAALDAFLIFLSITAVLLFIERSEFIILSDDTLRYGISIGISLAAALLLAVVKRKNFQDILIDIDTRLNLQDKLSTAYEYQHSGKKSDLLAFLLEDAAENLHHLETKHMAPTKFSAAHFALILLLVLNVVLFTSLFWRSIPRPMRADEKQIEKARTLLRNYTQSRIGAKPAIKKSPGDVYAQQLEQLSDRLSDPALNPDTLSASLNTLLKGLHSEQARLADELSAKLNNLRIEGLPIQSIPELGKLSSLKIEKLKKFLKGALNNQIPDTLDQDLEALEEFSNLEQLLSQIIDDLKEKDSAADEYAQSRSHKSATSKHTKDLPETREDGKHPEIDGGISNAKQGRMDATNPAASDQSQDRGGDSADDAGLPDAYDLSAGQAKSAKQKKSRDEIEKSKGPGIQDKLSSLPEKKYRIHIRSLSTIGESKLKEENIIQTYQQEIENVLQKEDIPLNYREFIKHYFISIGLKTEAKAYDAK